MKKSKDIFRRAFTLVELVVVIAIIAVLSAVSVVGYFGFTDKANRSNTNTLISQVEKLFKTFIISYDSEEVSKDESGVIDNGVAFIDYLDENGLDRSLFNVNYTPTVGVPDIKRAEGEENSYGILNLLIKGNGSYYSVFSIATINYGLISESYSAQIYKGLEKATKATKPAEDTSKVDLEKDWEFPISEKGVSDTTAERLVIRAIKGNSIVQTFATRYGKTITYDMLKAISNTDDSQFVSSEPLAGGYRNPDDGYYYLTTTSVWKNENTSFESLVDKTITKKLVGDTGEYVITYETTELNVSSNYVAYKNYKRGLTMQYFHFADANIAIEQLKENDTLFIEKSCSITKDSTIPAGASVNILYENQKEVEEPLTYSDNHGSTELLNYENHGSVFVKITENATLTLQGTLNISAVVKSS